MVMRMLPFGFFVEWIYKGYKSVIRLEHKIL